MSEVDDNVRHAGLWAEAAPFYVTLGLTLEDISRQRAKVRIGVGGRHLHGEGIVHGGGGSDREGGAPDGVHGS